MKKHSFFNAALLITAFSLLFAHCGKSGFEPDHLSSWHKLNTPFFGRLLDIQFTSSDTGYILGIDTTIPTGTTIMKTFDGGQTWQRIYFQRTYPSSELRPISQINVSPFNSNILFSFSQWEVRLLLSVPLMADNIGA